MLQEEEIRKYFLVQRSAKKTGWWTLATSLGMLVALALILYPILLGLMVAGTIHPIGEANALSAQYHTLWAQMQTALSSKNKTGAPIEVYTGYYLYKSWLLSSQFALPLTIIEYALYGCFVGIVFGVVSLFATFHAVACQAKAQYFTFKEAKHIKHLGAAIVVFNILNIWVISFFLAIGLLMAEKHATKTVDDARHDVYYGTKTYVTNDPQYAYRSKPNLNDYISQ